MGNSTSSILITPTPKTLSWGRQREDTVKLEDKLAQHEEDLWNIKTKRNISVGKARSVRYIHLAVPESSSLSLDRGGNHITMQFIGADDSSWTAVVPSSVTGLLGSCVVIPCSYNYPEPKHKATDFTGIWTENTNHIIYHPDGSKVMQQYQSRTELLGDLKKKFCSVEINPLRATDTGPFHFRIEIEGYDKFSYSENTVSITVINSPEPFSIELKEEVKVGENVSASCSASHSCPSHPPVFTWSHSGKLHTQSKELDNGQWKTTSSLTFHPTVTDHNKLIECTGTYKGGQKKKSSKVLKVKYAPVNVKVDYTSSVKEGDAVQLTCSSEGNPAAHSYQWHNDNGALLYTGHHYTLSNVSRHTSALYCTATNTQGQGKSSPVQLNVLYPPEIKVGSACSSDMFTVTCVCIVESKPPSMVQLLFPDGVLPGTKIEKHGYVTIGTLQGPLGSSGLVHCHANNTQGNATFILSVPTDNKMLYISISIGAFVIIVILLIALGVKKKWPEWKKSDNEAPSDFCPNDHIYGNMESVVASALFFGVVCWGEGARIADRNRINKLIRKASSTSGTELEQIQQVAERRMLTKLHSILDNPAHSLHALEVVQLSTFSRRLIPPKCRTERYRKSFLIAAIRLFNQHVK
ncbi:myelin-associated glycoprotein-like [Diretmus argenteus]